MSIRRRRSQMSAVAPAGSDSSMMGKVVEAWTRATMSAEGAIDVIIQEARTANGASKRFDDRQYHNSNQQQRGHFVEEAVPALRMSIATRLQRCQQHATP